MNKEFEKRNDTLLKDLEKMRTTMKEQGSQLAEVIRQQNIARRVENPEGIFAGTAKVCCAHPPAA